MHTHRAGALCHTRPPVPTSRLPPSSPLEELLSPSPLIAAGVLRSSSPRAGSVLRKRREPSGSRGRSEARRVSSSSAKHHWKERWPPSRRRARRPVESCESGGDGGDDGDTDGGGEGGGEGGGVEGDGGEGDGRSMTAAAGAHAAVGRGGEGKAGEGAYSPSPALLAGVMREELRPLTDEMFRNDSNQLVRNERPGVAPAAYRAALSAASAPPRTLRQRAISSRTLARPSRRCTYVSSKRGAWRRKPARRVCRRESWASSAL